MQALFEEFSKMDTQHQCGHPAFTGFIADPSEDGDQPERPFGTHERRLADQIAGRMHSELRTVLRAVPKSARSASGLARYLGMERTGCQRLVSALQTERPDAHLLTRLPGLSTLRAILVRAAEKGVDAEPISSAGSAVDRLEEFFDRAGGSQAGFARLLLISTNSGLDTPVLDASIPTAEALYQAARRSIGRWSEVQVQTAIYRPDPENPDGMQTARMRGFIGHRAGRGAPPLVLLNRKLSVAGAPSSSAEFEAIDQTQQGEGPSYAATPFCSQPSARIATRRGGGTMVQIVDSSEHQTDHGFDFVTADRSIRSMPLPTSEDPPLHEVWATTDYPAAGLLFDVWQHRDFAQRCIPSLSAHLYKVNVLDTPGDRWYTTLSGGPRLELLGAGLQNAESRLWSRQSEALHWMFERLEWDPRLYVGYRCELRHPLWRIGYLMAFDFSERTGDS